MVISLLHCHPQRSPYPPPAFPPPFNPLPLPPTFSPSSFHSLLPYLSLFYTIFSPLSLLFSLSYFLSPSLSLCISLPFHACLPPSLPLFLSLPLTHIQGEIRSQCFSHSSGKFQVSISFLPPDNVLDNALGGSTRPLLNHKGWSLPTLSLFPPHCYMQ